MRGGRERGGQREAEKSGRERERERAENGRCGLVAGGAGRDEIPPEGGF